MNIVYATYNMYRNSIDVYTYAGCFLRIDCNKAEEGLKTTPCSECALNALALVFWISSLILYCYYIDCFAWFINAENGDIIINQ